MKHGDHVDAEHSMRNEPIFWLFGNFRDRHRVARRNRRIAVMPRAVVVPRDALTNEERIERKYEFDESGPWTGRVDRDEPLAGFLFFFFFLTQPQSYFVDASRRG
jgi:hypothetical protein